MGKKVNENNLVFISFKPENGRFAGFLSMEAVVSRMNDPEAVIKKASKIYERALIKIRSLLSEIQAARADRKLVPARKMWRVGNQIFHLRDELAKLSLQLDGLYEHLSRDLNVKRTWLKKVVTFRRYISNEKLIPETLNWGRCKDGTRRIAERLQKGLPLDK